jgi:23S rRNA pseudouridine1911/1915/1917 synthase
MSTDKKGADNVPENASVIYIDGDILVAVKPRGLHSEDKKGNNDRSSFPAKLKAALGLLEIYTVHRLDKETEGLMVYALNKESAASLCRSADEGRFEKEYDAWIHGRPETDEGVMEDLLFKDSAGNKVYVVKRERKGVKKAVLSYETVEAGSYSDPNVPDIGGGAAVDVITHVRVRLQTGRTHQIRVQFASRKLPLLGDKKYGAKDVFDKLALCATHLSFPHPRTGEILTFDIPFDYSLNPR